MTVGIPPGTKLLRIERVLSSEWHVWIHANIDFTAGTFINLKDDGTIQRVTIEPDGSEVVFDVKRKKDGE